MPMVEAPAATVLAKPPADLSRLVGSYENRTRTAILLLATAWCAIVPGNDHAAAAFTLVALSLGRALRAAGRSCLLNVEARIASGVPCLLFVCHFRGCVRRSYLCD